MNQERQLACVVSGSFDKFKPEIDQTIDAFTDLGVNVLAPDKGWLYVPQHKIRDIKAAGFRPLPSEAGRDIAEIEEEFLRCIAESDFLFIVNINGYVGDSAALEIGFALGKGIPVYAKEKMSALLDSEGTFEEVQRDIKILPPEQVVFDVRNQSR